MKQGYSLSADRRVIAALTTNGKKPLIDKVFEALKDEFCINDSDDLSMTGELIDAPDYCMKGSAIFTPDGEEPQTIDYFLIPISIY